MYGEAQLPQRFRDVIRTIYRIGKKRNILVGTVAKAIPSADTQGSEMTSPVADLPYLELAEEFYQAFRDLPPNGPSGIPVNWPRYFALCHAIELALNAFLLAHGMTEQQLKGSAYGHNITALMAEAILRGLKIDPTVRSNIELLTEPHQKYWPRYPRQSGPVVIIDQLEEPSVELLKAVRLAIRGGNVLYIRY